MPKSKLGSLIATAFSNTVGETWNVCRALPSGMNWAVRFMNGAREICCWRTLETPASSKEAETMAKHAGFAAWNLEERTDAAKQKAWIVREVPALMPNPAALVDLETDEFEVLDVEVSNRTDLRPGLPLERPGAMQHRPGAMQHNQLYHFQAFAVLWTVKRERTSNKQDARTKNGMSNDAHHVFWAALEPLEGNQGMSDGTIAQFEAWFKLHGQLSPLEPPVRWRT